MPRYDLEDTYLTLDGQGGLARHAVEGFWEGIEDNDAMLGTLVAAFVSTEDWSHWEMHPEGQEVLVLIEGRMTMIFDEPPGQRQLQMRPGATCIVPKGVWHRALVPEASKFIAITYGAGTAHRPI